MTHSRRSRWLVPAALSAGCVAAANLQAVVPAGASIPTLPVLTAAQLLAKAQGANVETLTGTVSVTARLGLPDLGSFGGGSAGIAGLLAGTHVATIAIDGPDHLRVAMPSDQAETDWVRNGGDVWSWDSASQHAAHFAQAAPTPDAQDMRTPAAHDTPKPDATDPVGVDPIVEAERLLAKVTPTTDVQVRTPRYVAGRPVYELVLAPKDAASTIREAAISVDAATGLPLAVRIVAGSSASPAFEIGFTAVSFAKPKASTFSFTPPPGAIVTQQQNLTAMLSGRPGGRTRHHDRKFAPPSVAAATPAPADTATKVVGTGWASVLVVSGQSPAGLDSLLRVAQTVPVGAGSAKLVSSSLVNALVLPDGRIAIGAVTVAALEAVAATA